jgi:hypothetical protein
MPYRVDPKNKKCVQVKKSGNWQRKGCTNGPVKKYLAALYANTKDIKESEEFDWAKDMIQNFSTKFRFFRTLLKKGDEFLLTGDLKDESGEMTMLYLDKEPFIVMDKINKNEFIAIWSRPTSERPDGWEEVTDLNTDGIYFYSTTQKWDDELEVDFLGKSNVNESEDLDWALNLVQKIEPGLAILNFMGKEVMIDVRDMTNKEKENLLEVVKPYINENTRQRSKTSNPSTDDWSFLCLLHKTNIATLSLHCGTEDTDYIPEEGNVCCLSTTYEEEELTPKDLLISVNGKDLLKTNLYENEEWWTDTVNSFGTTESDVYYNEISDLLKGTPYEIVVEGMSFGNGKFFKIKHRDNVLSLDTWSERFFKPKDIWEDIVSQITYFNSNHEKLKGLYILLIPFFRKHGIKPNVLDESEDLDWAKDLITDISNNLPPTGEVLVTIDNWEKFRNVPVTRGPDWEYGSQDKGGSGFIEETLEEYQGVDFWVSVVWKNSSRNTYRIGPANHDLYFNFNIIEGKNKSKNLLTEGRFDKVTSSVVKDVMRYVNYLMDKKNIENTYNVRLPLEDDYYQEGDITFNVELDIMFQEMDGGFELRSNIIGYDDVDDDVDDDDYYDDENHDIGLQLYLNKTKGKTFYQQLYYKLIEDIRHEIEHLSQFDDISKKGEGARPKPIDYDQFEDVFSHHTDPAEIEALTQGFYIRAKKEKKPLDTVILDYLNSIEEKKAITPKQKTEILKNLLNYAKKNLPKAIYQQD